MTFAQLRDAEPGAFAAAAAAWDRLASAVERRTAAPAMPDERSWRGPAASAAAGHADRLRADGVAAYAHLTAVAQVLAGYADELAEARTILLAALDRAGRIPTAVVDDDGSVRITGQPPPGPGAHAVRAELAGVADEIARALRVADTADARTAAALAASLPGAARGTGRPRAAVPLPDTPPAEVHRWWLGLTEAQRFALLAGEPALIGGLDGVPAAARDRANRLVLARTLRQLRARCERLAALPTRTPAQSAELRRLRGTLAGVAAVEARLADGPGGDRPRAYLLALDPAGDGRAVVAVGDPDAAANVVTFVPGTGADLAHVGFEVARAETMAADAERAAGTVGVRTAGVAWLGYDAPDSLPFAADPRYAGRAEPALAEFAAGLRATHEGPLHSVLVGHSYGSTVVGFTARDRDLAVDDVVLVGSPGVGVAHARDLHLGAQHVWATTAANDPIRLAVSPLAGIRQVVGGDGAHALYYGADPARSDLGGRVFHRDPGPAPLVVGVGGSVPPVVVTVAAHLEYWQPGNPARAAIAAIVDGDYAAVR